MMFVIITLTGIKSNFADGVTSMRSLTWNGLIDESHPGIRFQKAKEAAIDFWKKKYVLPDFGDISVTFYYTENINET
jgi:hypothetical protein